jgi:cytochrome c5
MKKTTLLSAMTVCLLAACSPKTATTATKTPTKQPASATDTQLVEGKSIYTTKCGVGGYGCHSLYTVSMFTKQEWQHTVPTMAQKAKISAAEEKLVLLYVLNGAKK